ncbi:uncharacterized protein LOC120108762 [Phoenix dactylifera]|uniref:Uncharacterized protein LOC120108762 n=1 Tax=Phoenix dactylifera TaxID=42345 RepID=A0A8B8ZVT1_PHODC|nr:uncharacterized protein LOC120108762 [Phoenix dactylifera]
MPSRILEMLRSRTAEVVDVPEEELEGIRAEWRSTTVIVRSLGRPVSVDWVAREFKRVGRLDYNVECFLLMDGFIAVRFAKEENREAALKNGPWTVADQLLAMERWRPNFVPGVGGIDRVVVWLRLPRLPLDYWKREAILRIAASAGNPLAVDGFTEQGGRYGFARVKVELNVSNPLKPGTLVREKYGGVEETFWQGFIYKNLPAPCSKCGRIGHLVPECGYPSSAGGKVEPAVARGKEKEDTGADNPEVDVQTNGGASILEEPSAFGPWLVTNRIWQ